MQHLPEARREVFPAMSHEKSTIKFSSAAGKLRRAPAPLYVYLTHAHYRKWATSKIILKLLPMLPRGFKRRMRKRIEKHQGAAQRAVENRDALVAQLTVPARQIFLELEALYTCPPRLPQNR